MLETLLILFTIFFVDTKLVMYDIMDDTVICYNALYEHHEVSNSGYETVTCSYSSDKKSRFLLFLIPPAHVSNTVSCQAFGFKDILLCPNPNDIIGDRKYVIDYSMENFLRIIDDP